MNVVKNRCTVDPGIAAMFVDTTTEKSRVPAFRRGRLTTGGIARRLPNPAGIQRWIWLRLQQLPDVAELS
jgi:hypothetical protein